MLVWTLILTVVGYDGTESRITAKYDTVQNCYNTGNRVSNALSSAVESTGYACIRDKEHAK